MSSSARSLRNIQTGVARMSMVFGVNRADCAPP
jgi:hypothetical protein